MRTLALLLALAPLPALAQTAAPKPPACSAAEHHQFDFWIGRWDAVETADGKPGGRSLIEALYGGCALRENWTQAGYSGGSLNTYDRTTKQWRQTWTDSNGTWREYVGGLVDGRMVLVSVHPAVADPAKTVHDRMIFTKNADGTVRQLGEQSADGGGTWKVTFDYTYRPAR